jgi:hypothetical protein
MMEKKQRACRRQIWQKRQEDLLKDFKKIIEVIVKRHEEFMLEGVPQALEQMSLEEFQKLTERIKIKKKDMRDLVLDRSPRECSDTWVLLEISKDLTRQMTLKDYRRIAIEVAILRKKYHSYVSVIETMRDDILASYKEKGEVSPATLPLLLSTGLLDGTTDWHNNSDYIYALNFNRTS